MHTRAQNCNLKRHKTQWNKKQNVPDYTDSARQNDRTMTKTNNKQNLFYCHYAELTSVEPVSNY